jgi:hypothetical protein
MILVEASGVHGDGGHRRAGDSRAEAEASMGRSSVQHDGRKPDQKGHVSPRGRLCVK